MMAVGGYPVNLAAARTGAGTGGTAAGAPGAGGGAAFAVVGGAGFAVVGGAVVGGAVVVGAVVVVVGAVVVVVLVVVVGAVVVVVDVVVTTGGGKQNEMWLMPLPSGAVSPVSEVTPGAANVYTFAFGPPLTMTRVTGLFEVKLNAVGSPSALTAVTVIVTDRAPWLNVLDSPTPRSSMSPAWIVNVVVPGGQLGLPGCTTGATCVAGAWLTGPRTATSSAAATASAAAAAIRVAIRRPEKRYPRVVEWPIPSPCSSSRQRSPKLAVWGRTLGGALGPEQTSFRKIQTVRKNPLRGAVAASPRSRPWASRMSHCRDTDVTQADGKSCKTSRVTVRCFGWSGGKLTRHRR